MTPDMLTPAGRAALAEAMTPHAVPVPLMEPHERPDFASYDERRSYYCAFYDEDCAPDVAPVAAELRRREVV